MKKIWLTIISALFLFSACNDLADEIKVESSDWSNGVISTPVYLMSYQKSSESIDDDNLHFAYSMDGLKWNAVNNGNPVFKCGSGSLHIRDPFVFRMNDGKFVLLGADWTSSGKYWDLGSRSDVNNYWNHPSNKIYVAFSDDLVNWNLGHFMQLNNSKGKNGGTRHVWTPKAHYNKTDKCYDIYWVGDDANGENKVYRTQTYDFFTAKDFGEWKIYDPGYSVSAPCIVQDGSDWYMFTKDERNIFGTMFGGDIQTALSDEIDVPKFKIIDNGYINRTDDQITMLQADYPCVYGITYNQKKMWIALVNSTNSLSTMNSYATASIGNTKGWKKASDSGLTVATPSGAVSASVLKITADELAVLRNAF